jgi:hypothetical protein
MSRRRRPVKRELALSTAQLRGVARRKALADVVIRTEWTEKDGTRQVEPAKLHIVARPEGEIHRIGKDAVVFADGEGRYMLMSLAKLTELLREAKKLPIKSQVTVHYRD